MSLVETRLKYKWLVPDENNFKRTTTNVRVYTRGSYFINNQEKPILLKLYLNRIQIFWQSISEDIL